MVVVVVETVIVAGAVAVAERAVLEKLGRPVLLINIERDFLLRPVGFGLVLGADHALAIHADGIAGIAGHFDGAADEIDVKRIRARESAMNRFLLFGPVVGSRGMR